MDNAELQVVGTFGNRVEAEVAQGALRSAGIESLISADDAGGIRPDLGRRGIRLMVRAEDAEEAAALIGGAGREP
jgi:hypothetical protein